ncbi:MBL fold metallo-hydrolase [Chitinophaga polysaccharea]|uniref:MBL fold metallo-hydrolase n=1 Tax=Chitinophaga TaxID=79328 RepID=UPI001455652A|nr:MULTISPECIES: MBL fold metallo-hydrolase [Chitinophaga]NLR61775.1 MBL fold metallo-hydrolase [Chitinophaga polysaccharea]NLU92633.1 MBL fold metallo-hydrolase [Chitinophaga sp. Ak27]
MMKSVIQLSIFPLGMINSFVIRGTEKHILVDSGVPGSEDKILSQLKSHGIDKKDIGLIIITHGHIDHFGSAAALKQKLSVPVLTHELDAVALRTGKSMAETLKPNKRYWNILKRKLIRDKAIPCEPDIILEGDCSYDLHEWGVNGKVIHTPGHTPGSLSIILADGNAIIMDLASSGILLGGMMLYARMKHPPFHDDFPTLKRSIEKVLVEKADKFYLGHGGPVSRDNLMYYSARFL